MPTCITRLTGNGAITIKCKHGYMQGKLMDPCMHADDGMNTPDEPSLIYATILTCYTI